MFEIIVRPGHVFNEQIKMTAGGYFSHIRITAPDDNPDYIYNVD
jgi:hypothetical protein